MGEVLLLVLLVYLVFIIILYIGISYVSYRIVSKFAPGTSFVAMLIPIYSTYLLYRTAITRPGLYLLASFFLPLIGYMIGGENWSTIVGYVMAAHAIARVAEKLGNSYIKYFILNLIPFVIIFTTIKLAFDSSRPVGEQPQQSAAPLPPPLPAPPPLPPRQGD